MSTSKKTKRGEEKAGKTENKEDDASEESLDEDMENEGNESDEEMMEQEVQVDFTARNPEDCDFHGIKKLLQQVFLKANINLSEMTDTIISQNYVGSVIMQADDEGDEEEDEDEMADSLEVFGVTTVLNLNERQNLESVKQLKAFLDQKCKECSAANYEQVHAYLNEVDHHLGYLINERFINIPAQIALPAFESLWKEVERANKKKMPYSFSNFMMVCKTYKVPTVGTTKGEPELVFSNPEEEFFYETSKVSFSYSVAGERDTGVTGDWDDEGTEMEPLRTVIFIPSKSMANIMLKLQENLAV